MLDLAHQFGSDLSVSCTGDLALSACPKLTEERLLRRLLTNPGDYIWHLDYGAGLGRYVGSTASAQRIQAATRAQVLKERAVARSPVPTVTVNKQTNGETTAVISYGDITTGTTQPLTVSP